MENTERPNKNKWKALKFRTSTLLSGVPKKQGRVICFKTGEVLAENESVVVQPEIKQQEVLKSTGTSSIVSRSKPTEPVKPLYRPKSMDVPFRSKVPRKKPDFFDEATVHSLKWAALLFVIAGFLFFTTHSNAADQSGRNKLNGEYSALVENEIDRDSFDSQDEMLSYIAVKEKEIESEMKTPAKLNKVQKTN